MEWDFWRDIWSEVYLIATLLVGLIALFRGDAPVRWCAGLLLVWFLLANATYVRGEIETFETIFIGTIHVGACGYFIQRYQHWLPMYLCGSSVAMILWSFAYTGPSAETYKEIKNAIYIGEMLAVLIGCIQWRVPLGQLKG